MLMENIFQGEKIYLAAVDPAELGEAMARWGNDSEYMRLQDADPARRFSTTSYKSWIEKNLEENQNQGFWFTIRSCGDDRLIGDVSLWVVSWTHRDGFAGIGIGDRQDWGRGFGTEAMQLLLRFAFHELDLHRVSLNVFDYNPRAIRSYEKAGFHLEGRVRQAGQRDGQRYDFIYMGILANEWEVLNQGATG